MIRQKYIICIFIVTVLFLFAGCCNTEKLSFESLEGKTLKTLKDMVDISSNSQNTENKDVDNSQNTENKDVDNSQNTENKDVDNSQNTENKDVDNSQNMENQDPINNTEDNQNSLDKNDKEDKVNRGRVDARLIIDGKDVTGSHYVKMNLDNNTIEFPFLFVLDYLGAEVVDIDDSKVRITIQNPKSEERDMTYIFILDKNYRYLYGIAVDSNMDFEDPLSNDKDYIEKHFSNLFDVVKGRGTSKYFDIINDEVIVDNHSAGFILGKLVKRFLMDYDKHTYSLESY